MVLAADQMWVSEEYQPGGRHNVLGTGVITSLEPLCPDLCVDDQLIAVESPGEHPCSVKPSQWVRTQYLVDQISLGPLDARPSMPYALSIDIKTLSHVHDDAC
jgi:hypothetical protein